MPSAREAGICLLLPPATSLGPGTMDEVNGGLKKKRQLRLEIKVRGKGSSLNWVLVRWKQRGVGRNQTYKDPIWDVRSICGKTPGKGWI